MRSLVWIALAHCVFLGHSAVIQWKITACTGATTFKWNNTACWIGGKVPTANDDARFSLTSANVIVEIANTTTVSSLVFEGTNRVVTLKASVGSVATTLNVTSLTVGKSHSLTSVGINVILGTSSSVVLGTWTLTDCKLAGGVLTVTGTLYVYGIASVPELNATIVNSGFIYIQAAKVLASSNLTNLLRSTLKVTMVTASDLYILQGTD